MKQEVSARRLLDQKQPDNTKMHWLPPSKGETILSNWTVWWDSTNRYRVVLSVSKYGHDTQFSACRRKKIKTHDGEEANLIVFVGKEHYKHLENAMQACEEAHCKRFKLETVETNREDLIAKAEASKQDRVTVVAKPPSSKPSRPANAVSLVTGKARISMLGHPVTAVLRFMGKDEFDFGMARKVCDHFGIEVADNTIRAQLAAGRKNERGPAAALTQDEINKLYDAVEAEDGD